MPDLTGIAHLVLRVQDWSRSARWYQDVLGFQRRKGEGFSALSHPGASFVLLFRPAEEVRDPSSAPTQRLEHLALHVPTVAALEAWQHDLAAKGIHAELDHGTVGSSITLFDPDGLEIELFCPAAGSIMEPAASSLVSADPAT